MRKDSSYRSERLRFRGLSACDAELVVSWRSDPSNYANFFNAHPISMEEHMRWFNRYLEDETRYDFMVFDEEGNPIGTVGLSNITCYSCEISYMIGNRGSRGKGYATEAVEAMSRIAFAELGVSEVLARVLSHNEASAKVVLRAGYEDFEHVYRLGRPSALSDVGNGLG